MVDVFDLVQGPVLAVERVPRSEISSYGVVDAEPLGKDVMGGRVYKVRDLVEKPSVDDAPSDLAIIGRYILTPDIFDDGGDVRAGEVRRDSAHQRVARALKRSAGLA